LGKKRGPLNFKGRAATKWGGKNASFMHVGEKGSSGGEGKMGFLKGKAIDIVTKTK